MKRVWSPYIQQIEHIYQTHPVYRAIFLIPDDLHGGVLEELCLFDYPVSTYRTRRAFRHFATRLLMLTPSEWEKMRDQLLPDRSIDCLLWCEDIDLSASVFPESWRIHTIER